MSLRSVYVEISGEPTGDDTCVVGVYETRVSTEYPNGVAADVAARLVADNLLIEDPASLLFKAYNEDGIRETIDVDSAPCETPNGVFVGQIPSDTLARIRG